MRKFSWLAALLCIVATSCETLYVIAPKAAQVQVGWTTEQVVKQLGAPDASDGTGASVDYWVEGSRLYRFSYTDDRVSKIAVLFDAGADDRRNAKLAQFRSKAFAALAEGARAYADASALSLSRTGAFTSSGTPSSRQLAGLTGHAVSEMLSHGTPYAADIGSAVVCGDWVRCTYPAATYVYYTSEGWTTYVETRNGWVTDVRTVGYHVQHSPGASLNGGHVITP